jgi:hypothetical protein
MLENSVGILLHNEQPITQKDLDRNPSTLGSATKRSCKNEKCPVVWNTLPCNLEQNIFLLLKHDKGWSDLYVYWLATSLVGEIVLDQIVTMHKDLVTARQRKINFNFRDVYYLIILLVIEILFLTSCKAYKHMSHWFCTISCVSDIWFIRQMVHLMVSLI